MARRPIPPFARGLAFGFLAAGAVWAAAVLAQVGKPTYLTGWMEGMYEEKARIAERMEGPRIVLVGGSGVLFGIRAEQLTQELGIPAVNFGVNGGMDLMYTLYRAQRVLRPGDLVVLAIEYEVFGRPPFAINDTTMELAMAHDLAYLRSRSWITLLDSALRVEWMRLAKPWIDADRAVPDIPLSPYFAPHMNGYGDTFGNNPVIKHLQQFNSVKRMKPTNVVVQPGMGRVVGEFVAWCRERGIGVVATHPNIIEEPSDERPMFAQAVRDIHAIYAAAGVPILDTPRETMARPRAIYDAQYHIDRPEAEKRTALLLERLQPYVQPLKDRAHPVVFPTPDHELAKLHAQFHGWRPVEGFRHAEGPYPERKLPAVVWGYQPASTALVESAVARVAKVSARVQYMTRGQEVEVTVNGERVLRAALTKPGLQPLEFEAKLVPGDNLIVFTHHGVKTRPQDPRPLGLLFGKLAVE